MKDSEIMNLIELQTKVIPATQIIDRIKLSITPTVQLVNRFVKISNRLDAVDCFCNDPRTFISLLTQLILLKVQKDVQGLASEERIAELQQMEDPTLNIR